MFWLLVRSITGLNYYRVARAGRIWAPIANFHNPKRFGFDYRLSLRLRYVAWAVLVYGAILWSPFRWQILGLILIPQFFWVNVFNRIRAMAEHNGLPDNHELNGTRTVIPTLLDRLLIGPLNISYHLEHHLFPSVPWHNLRRLHLHLMANPTCAANAHVSRGYWGMIRELMPTRGVSGSDGGLGEAAAQRSPGRYCAILLQVDGADMIATRRRLHGCEGCINGMFAKIEKPSSILCRILE